MPKKFLLFSFSALCLMVLNPFHAKPATACGGFFCRNSPVDQAAERIVYTVNDDGTISTLIEIQYTGAAPDFSWILPIPEAISAEDLKVPENGNTVFAELHRRTDVQIIPPDVPSQGLNCIGYVFNDVTGTLSDRDSDVQVFATGEVGPFGFDVIGSAEPKALITWLRNNDYRVEPEMEPLINVYVEEQFAFVAMRLLDGQTSDSIKPIEITYGGQKPMIPLRLTAVAANNNMPIFVWIYGDKQAVPENYAHMEIATEEITFSDFGSNDYQMLLQERANALGGQAFITEFAAPANTVSFNHPYLHSENRQQKYLTRLATTISPHEMTLDPVFRFENRPDVSNIRDASNLTGLYDCEREQAGRLLNIYDYDAINPRGNDTEVLAVTPPQKNDGLLGRITWVLLLLTILVTIIDWRSRRNSQNLN